MTSDNEKLLSDSILKISAMEDQLTFIGHRYREMLKKEATYLEHIENLSARNNELLVQLLKIQNSRTWKIILAASYPYRIVRRTLRKLR